jgi:hypothetical protein
MSEAATKPATKQSWRPLLWGMAAFLLLPLLPPLDVLVPVQQTLLLFFPALAVCAIAGWRSGGRAALAIIWLAIAAWMLWQFAGPQSPYRNLDPPWVLVWTMLQPLGASGTAYSEMAPAWAMILGACFGLMILFSSTSPFFTRALGAVGVAVAVAFTLALSSPSGMARFQHAAGAEMTRRATSTAATLSRASNELNRIGGAAVLTDMYDEAADSEREIAKVAAPLLPALLALESLVALAMAWAVYRRLSAVQIGPPLSRLTEFRFNDQLVWGLAVGATLCLLPAFEAGKTAGYNLLLFFGALYLVRGMGVLAWMSRGRYLLLVALGLIPQLFVIVTVALGLGDTWLDLRRRAKPD